MRRLVLLCAAVACLLVPAARAQTFNDSITLNGRAVPLPAGAWRLLGEAQEPAFGQALGFRAVLLVQEVGTRLSGVVVARASTRANNAVFSNWDRRGACAQGDETIAVIVREANERSQNCARVTQWSTPTTRPPNPAPEFQKYFELAETQDGWAPARFQSVWVAIADNTGDLEVYYHFSPETRGFVRDDRPWAQNAWNPANQTQRQKEFLARLIAWGRGAHALVRVGFLGTERGLPGF